MLLIIIITVVGVVFYNTIEIILFFRDNKFIPEHINNVGLKYDVPCSFLPCREGRTVKYREPFSNLL